VLGLNELEVNSGFILLYPHEDPVEGRGGGYGLSKTMRKPFLEKRGSIQHCETPASKWWFSKRRRNSHRCYFSLWSHESSAFRVSLSPPPVTDMQFAHVCDFHGSSLSNVSACLGVYSLPLVLVITGRRVK
jgi:hypothetical protein